MFLGKRTVACGGGYFRVSCYLMNFSCIGVFGSPETLILVDLVDGF